MAFYQYQNSELSCNLSVYSAVCTVQVKQVQQWVHQKGARNFSGEGGQGIFQGRGGKTLKSQFLPLWTEHAHFVLNCTLSWGGGQSGGQDKIFSPLAPPLAWIHVHCRPGPWNDLKYYCKICYDKGTGKSDMTVRQTWCFTNFSFSIGKNTILKNYPLRNYFTHSDTCLKSWGVKNY